MPKRLLIAASAVSLLLGGCASTSARPATAPQARNEWSSFRDGFIEGTFQQMPDFAVYQGRHEFDGQIPDWSTTGTASRIAFFKSAIAAGQAFDGAGLSDEQRFERDYLVAVARGYLFWLETADQPHRNPAYYVGSLDPSVYVTRPYAPPETRLKAYIAYLKAVPLAAQQIRSMLKAPLPLSFVDYGKAGFGGFAEYYMGDGKAAFADVKDAALQRELDAATGPARQAMQGLADWMESQRATATQDFQLGPERFAQMLRDTEMVDIPLDRLQAVGRADLAHNQAALREACAAYAPGATIDACMAKMGADKEEGGSVAAARAQLAGLKSFIQQHDIGTIPGTEQAQVEEAPPYNRQNFAYISIPGPYEKGLPSVYYIAPPDPAWSAEVQAGFIPGKADLLFTTVHEVWPGHFLQFLHSNRSPFLFGKIFVGYAYAEGWAHYAEEMMWDAGLGDGDAETHVGQLSNALLRDCRFLSAIGMHTGQMTQEQSYRLFREQCFQDEGNARQQAARGTYDPAYLNYTLGKLMIKQLREDWTATRGGRQGWKAFHDKFLSYGGPPVPLVRAQMMGGAPQALFWSPR